MKLYDLSKLNEIGRGDQVFVSKMMDLFIDTIPKSAIEILNAVENEDIKTLKTIIHTIKPSIETLGIEILMKDIRTFESYDSTINTIDFLFILSKKIAKTLLKVVESMKKERNR